MKQKKDPTTQWDHLKHPSESSNAMDSMTKGGWLTIFLPEEFNSIHKPGRDSSSQYTASQNSIQFNSSVFV